MRHKQAHRAMQ